MNRFTKYLVSPLLLLAMAQPGAAGTLELAFRHVSHREPLQLGSLRYQNRSAETFSVTRASWLLSEVALQRDSGDWISVTNIGFIDQDAARCCIRVEVPAGDYHRLRFQVGLGPAWNHADPAQFPPDHPLNPNLNGLHWSWQGGYVFMALEGLWRRPGQILEGWAFHLARDTNCVLIELPASVAVADPIRVNIDFDVAAVLDGAEPISFARDGSSTHSRDADPVAAAIVTNLRNAFQVTGSQSISTPGVEAVSKPLDLPRRFTPYRFQTSSTFPMPDLPRDNPLIEERVELGKRLFHDPMLSRDGSISCASCHIAANGFSDPQSVSIGVDGRKGKRQSMPLLNLAWKTNFFWDGRAPSLRAQALTPIADHLEMDETLTNVVAKLARGGYSNRFAVAFSSGEITPVRLGLALEQFLLTLTSHQSKYDRAAVGVEKLNNQEQRGLELFMTEYDPRRGLYGADCFHCHGGALFRSQAFANNGLDETPGDRGRAAVTGLDKDEGKFSTPSLRNVALTAPYMHDGRFATLEEVVEHYSTGIKRSATLDPNLAKHPAGGLGLSAADKAALVAFLKTLTDEALSSETRRPPQTAAQ